MKLKTLAWLQILIGLLLLSKVIAVITNGDASIGFQLGATADTIYMTIFALLTGIYNLKQKK